MLIAAVCLAFAPGTATIDPSSISIPSGQEPIGRFPSNADDRRVGHQRLTLRYKVTAKQIGPGGGIRVAFGYSCRDSGNPFYDQNFGYLIGPGDNLDKFPLGRMQSTNPADADYVTARATPSNVRLAVTTEGHAADSAVLAQVVVSGSRSLRRNDEIAVTIGDTASGGPGATVTWHPGRVSVVVSEDTDGDGVYDLISGPLPELLVTADSPEQLRVNLPMTARDGSIVDGTLEVLQGADTPETSLLPCLRFAGTVRLFDRDDPTRALDVALDPSMEGVARFPFRFDGTGIHRLGAILLEPDGTPGPIGGFSNPVDVRGPESETAIYVGDMHRHACEGGHAALPEWDVWRTLWNSRFDFGVVIEHTYAEYHGFRHQNTIARAFQAAFDPAESAFVAFPGYEWSLIGSHRHVVASGFVDEPSFIDRRYQSDESPPPVSAPSLPALLDGLRNSTGASHLAIPHHMLWDQGTGDAYQWGPQLDDPLEPVVELFSAHGSSEVRIDGTPLTSDYVIHSDVAQQRPTNELATVRDALAGGRRVGFVGGSDNHAAFNNITFTSSVEHDYYARGGLTFVGGELASPALRSRIWDAIGKRRTWVTTGARIFVDWYAAGSGRRRGPGGELLCREPTFHLRVVPSGIASRTLPRVERYEIWRDGQVKVDSKVLLPPVDELVVEFADKALPRDGQFHSYYAKAVQDDDHVAWASPIWVKYQK